MEELAVAACARPRLRQLGQEIEWVTGGWGSGGRGGRKPNPRKGSRRVWLFGMGMETTRSRWDAQERPATKVTSRGFRTFGVLNSHCYLGLKTHRTISGRFGRKRIWNISNRIFFESKMDSDFFPENRNEYGSHGIRWKRIRKQIIRINLIGVNVLRYGDLYFSC